MPLWDLPQGAGRWPGLLLGRSLSAGDIDGRPHATHIRNRERPSSVQGLLCGAAVKRPSSGTNEGEEALSLLSLNFVQPGLEFLVNGRVLLLVVGFRKTTPALQREFLH